MDQGLPSCVFTYIDSVRSLQSSLEHRTSISCNHRTVEMACGSRAQKDHQSCNILRTTQTTVRGEFFHLLHAALGIDQTTGHLGRVEARGDGVGQDVPGSQFHGQILGQVDGSRLGGRVTGSGVLANGANADSGHGGSDNDARGLFEGRLGGEEGSESGF